MIERKEGYYWIKYLSEWQIGKFHQNRWYLTYDILDGDDNFSEINENRIPEPREVTENGESPKVIDYMVEHHGFKREPSNRITVKTTFDPVALKEYYRHFVSADEFRYIYNEEPFPLPITEEHRKIISRCMKADEKLREWFTKYLGTEIYYRPERGGYIEGYEFIGIMNMGEREDVLYVKTDGTMNGANATDVEAGK